MSWHLEQYTIFGGSFKKTKTITVKNTTSVKSKIHELLHCRTEYGNSSKVVDFVNASVNEGVVELFAEIICEDNGIPFNPTYTKQVEALTRIAAGLQYDKKQFAKDLFEVPFSQRYNWIERLVDDVIKNDKVDILTQATLVEDLGIVYGKIKRKKKK